MKKEQKVFDPKNQLIEYLKKQNIDNSVTSLWNYAKEWAENNKYVMGGSYASWGTEISVNLKIKEEQYRFNITLKQVA